MRYFPVFLGTGGERVVIVGGGQAAAAKFRLLEKSSASIDVLADSLDYELSQAYESGRIRHFTGSPSREHFLNARLAISATGCAALDAIVASLARSAGTLVNVVDRPALSDFTMPAIIDRDPVVVAIGTEGTAPVFARRIKTQIEKWLPETAGEFARQMGELRPRIALAVPREERRAFWEWVFSEPYERFAAGDQAGALSEIIRAIADDADHPARGHLTIVAPPEAPDLVTLRAVRRLQAADRIYHGLECSRDLLELARRDAERFVLGVDQSPNAWGLTRDFRQACTARASGEKVVLIVSPAIAEPILTGLGAEYEVVSAAMPETSDRLPHAEQG